LAEEFGRLSFSGMVSDYLEAGRTARSMPEEPQTGSETESQIAFVDSSALVALADAGDSSHQAAVDAYRELVASGYRFFTTDYMIVETFELLRSGQGPEVAGAWLQQCRLATYHVDERDLAKAKQRVLAQHEQSLIGLNDAISLAVMDRLGVTDVFAVDQSVLSAIS
jgi:predicted nucleic acid-binding protein